MTEPRHRGFTLIELMITVAIIGILAAVALPMYNDYIQTSREGVLINNIASIEIFQEDFRMRTGDYLTVAADVGEIENQIGWNPQDDGSVAYSIAANGPDGYRVTAVDAAGTTVCFQFPDKIRCP